MQQVYNKDDSTNWVRPWNITKFDDLYNRDERYFAILMKGTLSWLNRNIIMYNEPIQHFIFNTGSSYLYIENDGYSFSWSETSGEDQMYMHMPRCIVTMDSINIPTEELTQPFSRATYERYNGKDIYAYNAEVRRLPIEMSLSLQYVLSNFNETIILLQELVDKIVFQKYFNITYLGQVIECSIELPGDFNPEINKIDMSSTDTNQKTISLNVKICSNYPIVDRRSEIPVTQIISNITNSVNIYSDDPNKDDSTMTDRENVNSISENS